MKKTYFIALLLLIVLCLGACSPTGDGTDTTTSTTTTTTSLAEGERPTPTELDIVVNGSSDYKIVRAMNAPSTVTGAAARLTEALNTAYGTSFVQTDYLNKEEVPDGAREILIGETNRKVSMDADLTLRTNDYVICTRGYSIAILGGSPAATATAVDYFIEHYITEGASLTLSPDLSYRKDGVYKYQSFKVDGADLLEYRIISHATTKLERYALSLLVDTVREQTGVRLQTYTSAEAESAHEIRFGKSGRNQFSIAHNVYAIQRDGGSVNLQFEAGSSLAAVRALLDRWFGTTATAVTTTDATVTIGAQTLSAYAQSISDTKKLESTTYISLCDQMNSEIAVLDYSNLSTYLGNTEKAWRWLPKANNGNELLLGTNRVDEARLRYSDVLEKFVLCVTSSSGGVWVSEYNGGRAIWETNLSGKGPHSVEYLPNGFLVIACSGNNDTDSGFVRIYNLNNIKNSTDSAPYTDVSFKSAHGVIWDPAMELLWAVGSTNLVGYRIGTAADGKTPTITADAAFTYTIPGGGLHDITIAGHDSGKLWLCGNGVYLFDKAKGTYTTVLEKGTAEETAGYKSAFSFTDGTLVCVRGTGNGTDYPTHDSKTILFYSMGTGGTYATQAPTSTATFTSRYFYKVRHFRWQY